MRTLIFVLLSLITNSVSYSQQPFVLIRVIDSDSHRNITSTQIFIHNNKNVNKLTLQGDSIYKIDRSQFSGAFKIEAVAEFYKKATINLDSTIFNPKVNSLLIKLNPVSIDLREVQIRKRRYRDTVKIDLNTRTFEKDKMINTIFSGELGFSKDSNGQIYFKGKKVSDLVVNGQNFFGKNNQSIFDNVPAYILSDIEVTSTDIDSLTNTTMGEPVIKVNLILKDKHSKGVFGNNTVGLGSANRGIIATEIYSIKKKQQLSLNFNQNNLNSSGTGEPILNFSTLGNNNKTKTVGLNYRNIFFKEKIEINALLKGKLSTFLTEFNSERNDEIIKQYSKVFNSSKVKSSMLEALAVDLVLRIDSLNSIRVNSTLEYENKQQADTSAYLINFDGNASYSNLKRTRSTLTKNWKNTLNYQRLSHERKGRSFDISINWLNKQFNTDEDNLITDIKLNSRLLNSVISTQDLKNKNYSLQINVLEPLNEDSYFRVTTLYQSQKYDHSTNLNSNSVENLCSNNNLKFNYIEQKLSVYSLMGQTTFDFDMSALVYLRKILSEQRNAIYNFVGRFTANHKLDADRKLFLSIAREANFADENQLTTINNSFDVISQSRSNPDLKPEIKNKLNISWDIFKTSKRTVSLILNAQLSQFRFGLNLTAVPGKSQHFFIDNIGSSNDFDLTSVLSTNQNLTARLGIYYQELPNIINAERQMSKNMGVRQTFSFNKTLLRDAISVLPSISIAFNRYHYSSSSGGQLNFSYMDTWSFRLNNFQLTIYPFLNYNRSLSDSFSFAANAELRANFFKKKLQIWFKGYDIFNSFNYMANFNTATFVQDIRYKNVKRYFLLGATMKFNKF
ncbi:outer membrane beta-barrel protein [uncultured Pedobacter sp.]|uniref:outer membrane beta-barrel protein n=1 Tax=uncultured Pedobacter sp. TaxID=246139 RepID=UPI0025E3C44A|nr:outer membrane beta-barrel protein [uncultured Pedobacter sp.]